MSDAQAQLYDLTVSEFEHVRVDFLIKEEGATMHKYFDIVELTEHEAGLVYKNASWPACSRRASASCTGRARSR
jgi:hypothetical protein